MTTSKTERARWIEEQRHERLLKDLNDAGGLKSYTKGVEKVIRDEFGTHIFNDEGVLIQSLPDPSVRWPAISPYGAWDVNVESMPVAPMGMPHWEVVPEYVLSVEEFSRIVEKACDEINSKKGLWETKVRNAWITGNDECDAVHKEYMEMLESCDLDTDDFDAFFTCSKEGYLEIKPKTVNTFMLFNIAMYKQGGDDI